MTELIIPMAGEGRRFQEVGITTPKPLIDVCGSKMFSLVVKNLNYPWIQSVTLISRFGAELDSEIQGLSKVLNKPVRHLSIPEVSQGPADTARMAVEEFNIEGPILIANSDQLVDPNFSIRPQADGLDGWIPTFQNSDPKWSYLQMDEFGYVSQIAEKVVISCHATAGLYFFQSASTFRDLVNEMERDGIRTNGELYVAPAYNLLISKGGRVLSVDLGDYGENFWGIGTPQDLKDFLNSSARSKVIKMTNDRIGL